MNSSLLSNSKATRLIEPVINTLSISSIFEFEFHADIFMSRCQDTG